MRIVEALEAPVVKAFKELPAMPEKAKENFAKAWPWLAVVVGIFQFLTAVSLWNTIQAVDRLDTTFQYLTNEVALSPMDHFFMYLGIGLMLANAAILVTAYSHLAKRTKRGWDLLFLTAVLNVGYAILILFVNSYGFGSFLFSLLISALWFYVLVQVREKYGVPKTATKSTKERSKTTVDAEVKK